MRTPISTRVVFAFVGLNVYLDSHNSDCKEAGTEFNIGAICRGQGACLANIVDAIVRKIEANGIDDTMLITIFWGM
jgi:hypothetical protein